MDKEKKPDLNPADEALEQRVHDMLDVTVEDPKPAAEQPVATSPEVPAAKKVGKSVPVTFHEEPEPAKESADSDLNDAIEAANNELADQVGTAPLVEPEKVSKPTKVTVTTEESTPATEKTESASAEPTPAETPEGEAVTDQQKKPDVTVGELMDEQKSPLEAAIESPETEKAVSDIIAKEGDELLAAQDTSKVPADAAPVEKKPSLLGLILRSPGFRWFFGIVFVLGLVGAGAFPASRYFLLNKAGVKSTASIIVTDQSTLQPLKNVKVSVAGKTAVSGKDGRAELRDLPLGPTELVIEKRAFASHHQKVTVGWGSNPLGSVGLQPQGSQYVFQVNDLFSGDPITEVEASVGEATANANEKGEIKLTLDSIEEDKITVTFIAPGYRNLETELDLSRKEPTTVTMTPAKQVAFISKRSGTYDLYKIDADGKNESLVIKGTGQESPAITLLPHPTDDVAILISMRNGTRSSDGSLQQDFTMVNLKNNSTKHVVASSQIKAIDWVGTRLVYVMLDDNAGPEDPARFKLMSYDYKSGDNRQLATTNYFNSVLSVAGKIYYAPASAFQNGVNVGVFVAHADGSGKQVLLTEEAWNMLRLDYDKLTIAVEQDWYSYTPGADKPQKISGQPADVTSRVYTTNPKGNYSAWIDVRDGKGVVVLYDVQKKSESVIVNTSGVSGPVRWLNDQTLIYRISTPRETADYAIGISGGSPKKIVDVTDTKGIDRWSY